jgi:hypothetical protein
MMKRKKQQTRSLRKKKKIGRRIKTNAQATPRTAEQLYSRPERFQEKWRRTTHVISKMRSEGASLSRASRQFGVNPSTVVRLAGSALRKRTNGRYATKASDRLLRVLAIPNSKGSEEIAVRDSRQATQLAEYWIALTRYLQTGDASAIEQFQGKSITDASGREIPLLTDLNELDRLGNAGEFSFESLYVRSK